MKLKNTLFLVLAFVILLFAGIIIYNNLKPEDKSQNSEGKPVVAVSIVPEEAFVNAVCGDLAEAVVMVPPGFSPESYEPTPKEMVKFSNAKIYFSIGVPVEETAVLPALGANTKLVSLDKAAAAEYAELMIDGGRDPHIWLSPKRAIIMVQTISDEMCLLDPDNADIYKTNAASYIEKLRAADLEIKQILEGASQRAFIVFHPAFGYFADEYGLTMYALEEHGKEATAAGLMAMTDFAKEKGIKAVFYQAEVDSSQSKAFAEEIGGKTVMLDPLSGDYIDNLMVMAKAIGEGAK